MGDRLVKDLWPSFQRLEVGSALKLVYSSTNKVEAVEDAVLFAPQLFRLQKAVLLSEPLETLYGHTHSQSRVSRDPQERFFKAARRTLEDWHNEREQVARAAEGLRKELREPGDVAEPGEIASKNAELERLE